MPLAVPAPFRVAPTPLPWLPAELVDWWQLESWPRWPAEEAEEATLAAAAAAAAAAMEAAATW